MFVMEIVVNQRRLFFRTDSVDVDQQTHHMTRAELCFFLFIFLCVWDLWGFVLGCYKLTTFLPSTRLTFHSSKLSTGLKLTVELISPL
jgi:hypothetical protein